MKRRIECLFVAVVMICMFLGSSTVAFAENQSTNNIGAINFEKYLNRLPPNLADEIRNDPELVYMMTQDSYWKKNVQIMPHASVSLPLDEYKEGSYFTVNGKACTCHASCTYAIPDGGNYSRCYSSAIGGPGNCKRYNGAIQCKGFADYVYKQYTGKDTTYDNQLDESYLRFDMPNDTSSRQYMSLFMQSLGIGGNVRVSVRGQNYNHSFILKAVGINGVILYDCNGGSSRCQVRVIQQDWTQLVEKYDGLIAAWKA